MGIGRAISKSQPVEVAMKREDLRRSIAAMQGFRPRKTTGLCQILYRHEGLGISSRDCAIHSENALEIPRRGAWKWLIIGSVDGALLEPAWVCRLPECLESGDHRELPLLKKIQDKVLQAVQEVQEGNHQSHHPCRPWKHLLPHVVAERILYIEAPRVLWERSYVAPLKEEQ